MLDLTLALIKPDAVKRGLVGEIISIYEKNRLEIINLKWVNADQALLKKHYSAHIEKPFYPALEAFMRSGPSVALVLRGENVIQRVRQINGDTDPAQAQVNTIRYLYGTDVRHNAVHGSEDEEAAKTEIDLWF